MGGGATDQCLEGHIHPVQLYVLCMYVCMYVSLRRGDKFHPLSVHSHMTALYVVASLHQCIRFVLIVLKKFITFQNKP